MNFIERLTEILKRKNITGYKLCKDVGLPLSSINNWKKGSLPTIDKFTAIIKYLEISPYYLLGIEENKEIENNNFLSKEEQEIIQAYRIAEPSIQSATKKILDVKEEREISSVSKTG